MKLAYLEIDYRRSTFDAMTARERRAFMERASISWLYHEHAIEGVVLSEADIHRALEGRPSRNYCDGRTQRSLRRLHASLAEIQHQAAFGCPEVTLEWLKERHAALCDQDDPCAGRYRKRDTSPGVYNLDVSPASSISYYFRKFIDMYETELRSSHPVRAAALAHWEFMHVFPFDERTGFVGRLMLNYILLRNDYPPAIFHAQDRHHYFGALGGHRADMVPVVVEAGGSTIRAAEAFCRARVEPQTPLAAY